MEIAISITASIFSGLLVSVINKYFIHNKKNQCCTVQTQYETEVIKSDSDDERESDKTNEMTTIYDINIQLNN